MDKVHNALTNAAIVVIRLIRWCSVTSLRHLLGIAKENPGNTRIQDEISLAYKQILHLEREIAITRSEKDFPGSTTE